VSLRDYQVDLIGQARNRFSNGAQSVLLQSPTGSGKTVMITDMMGRAVERGRRCWFVVHRQELVNQAAHHFSRAGLNYGIISNKHAPNPEAPIQVCSIKTLYNMMGQVQTPDFVAWDECHHVAAGQWDAVYRYAESAKHIGLSATPIRKDGTGLRKWFDTMVRGPEVKWLIGQGYLSKYKMYGVQDVDTSQVPTLAGDYKNDALSALMDRPTIIGSAISHYNRIAPASRGVVFALNIQHSKNIVAEFIAHGIPAAHVDGSSSDAERDKAIRALESGDIKVLSNVDLFGEGFDLPAIETVLLMRPTQSIGLHIQQIGRCLRPHDTKDYAYIIDAVGNCSRLGGPSTERVWDLDGTPISGRKKVKLPINVKVCQGCFAAAPSTEKTCQYCGDPFPVKVRKVIHIDGELVELTDENMQSMLKLQQARARTLDQLIAVGKERGYKSPHFWAKKIMESRGARG